MVATTGWREPISISGAGKVVGGILRQRPCFLRPLFKHLSGRPVPASSAAAADAFHRLVDLPVLRIDRRVDRPVSISTGSHANDGRTGAFRNISVTHDLTREAATVMRKLIAFDEDTFGKLKQLARDRMETLQDLADEAFADLLEKHGIPADLKDALRKSAAVDRPAAKTKESKTRSR
ncbi:hypothetical protein [Bradyrhizobium sp. CCGUVB1N3]|uniref:hypothetical protein n=1 Tax=Bradyrhizobium sp. CCGUVB1N3 TaxID=2949629 RepID=UPI00353185AA